MMRLRDRLDSGPLSFRASVAVGLAVVGIVVAYLIGTHQQRTRQLPQMASAVVTHHAASSPTIITFEAEIAIDQQHAQHLADVLNRLPHFPAGEMHCGSQVDAGYLVQFVTTKGAHLDAHVSTGGCNRVAVSDGSVDWGWDRWDRDGAASAAIGAAVARR